MYYHFLRPRLGLDYGLHTLNVDAHVLEMAKYVTDNKIILVYVKHRSSNVDSSIFVTPKKDVAIAVDNHLRKVPIEIDSSPGVNRNLTPIFVEGPIVVESADDPFEDLDKILGIVRKHSVETRRKLIMVKNDKEMVRVRCEGIILALVPYAASDIDMGKNVFSQTQGGPVIRENNISGKQMILGKDKTDQWKGKKVNKQKNEDKYSFPWTMLVAYTNKGRWKVRTLIEDHNCIQSREIKACTSRFISDHIIKTLATNHDIPLRAVQDQMQKQFEVGVSKMKAFREKRIATDKMTCSFREQYSLLKEYP
nr:hypothetical protein [Tanacetum cinerariifolium]